MLKFVKQSLTILIKNCMDLTYKINQHQTSKDRIL